MVAELIWQNKPLKRAWIRTFCKTNLQNSPTKCVDLPNEHLSRYDRQTVSLEVYTGQWIVNCTSAPAYIWPWAWEWCLCSSCWADSRWHRPGPNTTFQAGTTRKAQWDDELPLVRCRSVGRNIGFQDFQCRYMSDFLLKKNIIGRPIPLGRLIEQA